MANLRELRAWHQDWAETARSVITRRDYRIRLGLAQRRSAAEEDAPDEGKPDGGKPEECKPGTGASGTAMPEGAE
jgi:hypothetical protein